MRNQTISFNSTNEVKHFIEFLKEKRPYIDIIHKVKGKDVELREHYNCHNMLTLGRCFQAFLTEKGYSNSLDEVNKV